MQQDNLDGNMNVQRRCLELSDEADRMELIEADMLRILRLYVLQWPGNMFSLTSVIL